MLEALKVLQKAATVLAAQHINIASQDGPRRLTQRAQDLARFMHLIAFYDVRNTTRLISLFQVQLSKLAMTWNTAQTCLG